MTQSREVRLKDRPVGLPSAKNFELATVTLGAPGPGEVQVKNTWMTVDPYMRGRMYAGPSYSAPFNVGEAMTGGAIGEVIASNAPSLKPGDIDRLTGDAASALAQFDHALAIEANLRSPTFLSHLYMARSEALLALERWDEAMDASQRAFDHATQHRPARDTAAAASNLADLFARQGDEAQRNAWRQRAET